MNRQRAAEENDPDSSLRGSFFVPLTPGDAQLVNQAWEATRWVRDGRREEGRRGKGKEGEGEDRKEA